MWDWVERRQQRYRDLRQGADADLVRDNNKRWKLYSWLAGCALLLRATLIFVKSPEPWHKIVVTIFIIALFGGMALFRWAYAWQWFIRRPDPKEPPSLFK